MSEVHWVKLSTAMFDDEKIRVIETMPSGGDICLIWVKLIVLAGRTNDGGMVYLTKHLPYTPDMLARIFAKPVETIRLALDTFVKLEMVEIDKDAIIVLVNWDKHQNIEGMDRIRQLTRDRVKRFREKQKLLTGDATVTLPNAIDSDSELDSEEEKKALASPSVKPKKQINHDFEKKVRNITNYYQDMFMEEYGVKPQWGVKNVELVRFDLRRMSDKDLGGLIQIFFEDKTAFVESKATGMEYNIFHSQIGCLLEKKARRERKGA